MPAVRNPAKNHPHRAFAIVTIPQANAKTHQSVHMNSSGAGETINELDSSTACDLTGQAPLKTIAKQILAIASRP